MEVTESPRCSQCGLPHWGTVWLRQDANQGQADARWLSVEATCARDKHLEWQPIAIVRSDVKESQDRSLKAFQAANAPDARIVIKELDETDVFDAGLTPGGEIISDELLREGQVSKPGQFAIQCDSPEF